MAPHSPPGGLAPDPEHREVYTNQRRAITTCNRTQEVLEKKDATNQLHQGTGLLCASVSPPARCPPCLCKCKLEVTRGPAQIKPSLWENQCVYLSGFAPIPRHTGRAGNLGYAVIGWLSPSPGLFRKQGSQKKKENSGFVCFFPGKENHRSSGQGGLDSAQSHSEMDEGSGPCYDSGPHLNLDPKLWNNIALGEDCQD